MLTIICHTLNSSGSILMNDRLIVTIVMYLCVCAHWPIVFLSCLALSCFFKLFFFLSFTSAVLCRCFSIRMLNRMWSVSFYLNYFLMNAILLFGLLKKYRFRTRTDCFWFIIEPRLFLSSLSSVAYFYFWIFTTEFNHENVRFSFRLWFAIDELLKWIFFKKKWRCVRVWWCVTSNKC